MRKDRLGVKMAEIIFEHVTKMFQNEIALEDVSFEIEKGEFVFVIGRSGAGKSTLLHLITMQEEITSGKITVKGKRLDLIKRNKIPYYRRRLGIMTSEVGLLNDRSVYDNIMLALYAVERDTREMRTDIMRVLGLVGIAGKSQSYPAELSGGEQARALLARALVLKPDILVADEPTANLDEDAAWDLMQLLKEINYQGMTVIVVSHARELVTIMKRRCLTLVAGTLVADEKYAIYNSKALDIFEERRILREREQRRLLRSLNS